MKSRPDCIVCLFKQALNTARIVDNDPEVHRDILVRLGGRLDGLTLGCSPAALSQPAYQVVSEVTGIRDPYKDSKRETNQLALQLLSDLRHHVASASDPLNAALHVAVAGNIIDLGIGQDFDIERDVLSMLEWDFAISAVERFRAELVPHKRLLYLGDNAGEIVFDQVLIQLLIDSGIDVVYSVKSGPIINDATMEDAVQTGMTGLTRVIETGSDDIGVNWDKVSNKFRETFESADVILSKGHGNYETCDGRPENIYFLLKAKCEIVAQHLGVNLGDIVFKWSRTG